MPNDFLNNKGIEIKKQKYKLANWSYIKKVPAPGLAKANNFF